MVHIPIKANLCWKRDKWLGCDGDMTILLPSITPPAKYIFFISVFHYLIITPQTNFNIRMSKCILKCDGQSKLYHNV